MIYQCFKLNLINEIGQALVCDACVRDLDCLSKQLQLLKPEIALLPLGTTGKDAMSMTVLADGEIAFGFLALQSMFLRFLYKAALEVHSSPNQRSKMESIMANMRVYHYDLLQTIRPPPLMPQKTLGLIDKESIGMRITRIVDDISREKSTF